MKNLSKIFLFFICFPAILLVFSSKIHAKDCTYLGANKKTLHINGNSVTVEWDGSNCIKNSSGKCKDGYKENDKTYPGIMNWSTVDSGKNTMYGAEDAYKNYAETGECPGYLINVNSGSNNYVFLSNGSSPNSFKNIKSAASKVGKLNKDNYYYNNDEDHKIATDNDLTCKYKFSDDNEDKEKLTIDIKTDGTITGKSDSVLEQVVIYSKMYSNAYISSLEKNKCPKTLSACDTTLSTYMKSLSTLGGLPLYSLLNATKVYQVVGDPSITKDICNEQNLLAESKLVNFVCIGDNCSSVDICQAYDGYKEELKADLTDYKSGVNNDSNKKILETYEEDKKEFKEYCKSVLKTLDYVDGGCMEKCVNINRDIAVLEIEKGLKSNETDYKCNIGPAVINLFYNVLKWMKYIAPVLVIILSILDFIKALASQNDDDQKKAQGKFVKRLIIAALLFLLPLIINFMLNAFGLFNSECDITDLF